MRILVLWSAFKQLLTNMPEKALCCIKTNMKNACISIVLDLSQMCRNLYNTHFAIIKSTSDETNLFPPLVHTLIVLNKANICMHTKSGLFVFGACVTCFTVIPEFQETEQEQGAGSSEATVGTFGSLLPCILFTAEKYLNSQRDKSYWYQQYDS